MTAVLELAAGILLAAGAVYLVLRPIFRPEMGGIGNPQSVDESEGEDPDDDFSARAVALRALKEIEFDRATGKLSDADYDSLKTKYTTEALAALRVDATGGGMRDAGSVVSDGASHPASRISHPAPRIPHPVCPNHGLRPEADAQFCSECGRRLATAPGYCARCGTALEHDAHYCHSCGARVAA